MSIFRIVLFFKNKAKSEIKEIFYLLYADYFHIVSVKIFTISCHNIRYYC